MSWVSQLPAKIQKPVGISPPNPSPDPRPVPTFHESWDILWPLLARKSTASAPLGAAGLIVYIFIHGKGSNTHIRNGFGEGAWDWGDRGLWVTSTEIGGHLRRNATYCSSCGPACLSHKVLSKHMTSIDILRCQETKKAKGTKELRRIFLECKKFELPDRFALNLGIHPTRKDMPFSTNKGSLLGFQRRAPRLPFSSSPLILSLKSLLSSSGLQYV